MKGSYVLLLRLRHEAEVAVGHLGRFRFDPGLYAYCGSGLGGVEARLARHKRGNKKLHWHIDYFLEQVDWVGAWVFPGELRLECELASILAALSGAAIPAPGFGASDCSCRSHLIALSASTSAISSLASLGEGRQTANDVVSHISERFASAALEFTFEA